MIEILWHGRGGQGAFTAARLLGAAASMSEGAYALAFPSFGPERRGAPMRAFTKIDASPIGDRSAITRADFVIYLDDTLLDTASNAWQDELKEGGRVLVNSVRTYTDSRIIALDANGISESILGRPIPNTVFLGALAVLCTEVDAEEVVKAIRQYMPAKLHTKNERIVEEALRQTCLSLDAERDYATEAESPLDGSAPRSADAENADAAHAAAVHDVDLENDPKIASEDAAENVSRETLDVEAAWRASGITAEETSTSKSTLEKNANLPKAISATVAADTDDVVRTCDHIPLLRSHLSNPPSLDHSVYARTTCYPAGHLVAKNAGWRNERPVIDPELCTGCLQCYLYCPDGTVYKSALTPVAIDYDFCKGCGVCAKACKFDAITMVPESEAILS